MTRTHKTRWVPYPARSKRAGAVLGAQSADEVGPAKSRKGPKPEPRDRRLRFSNKGARYESGAKRVQAALHTTTAAQHMQQVPDPERMPLRHRPEADG